MNLNISYWIINKLFYDEMFIEFNNNILEKINESLISKKTPITK